MTSQRVAPKALSQERQLNVYPRRRIYSSLPTPAWEPDQEWGTHVFQVPTEPIEELSARNRPFQIITDQSYPRPVSLMSTAWHEYSHRNVPIEDISYLPTTNDADMLRDHRPASRSQSRLDEVNQHFRRKAAAVLNDEAALGLLELMHSQRTIETSEFNFCRDGQSLAKLTAAHFCEIGANNVYITHRGQQFINLLDNK